MPVCECLYSNFLGGGESRHTAWGRPDPSQASPWLRLATGLDIWLQLNVLKYFIATIMIDVIPPALFEFIQIRLKEFSASPIYSSDFFLGVSPRLSIFCSLDNRTHCNMILNNRSNALTRLSETSMRNALWGFWVSTAPTTKCLVPFTTLWKYFVSSIWTTIDWLLL